MIAGEPWFVAVDVARCLGLDVSLGGCSRYLGRLSSKERFVLRHNEAKRGLRQSDCGRLLELFPKDGGPSLLTLISESGLYKLIMRSDKPIAATFQDWVTQEVLPSIRKTGSYSMQREDAPVSRPALPAPSPSLEGLEPHMPFPGSIAQRLRAFIPQIWRSGRDGPAGLVCTLAGAAQPTRGFTPHLRASRHAGTANSTDIWTTRSPHRLPWSR